MIIHQVSGLWQSPSWPPGKGHPDYINACAEVSFSASAGELLSVLHHVEDEFGRERIELNAPRALDLDLLDFKEQQFNTPALTIPHPRMSGRAFVLFPLSQIAPNWQHPITGEHIEATIAKLPLADVRPMRYLGALNYANTPNFA